MVESKSTVRLRRNAYLWRMNCKSTSKTLREGQSLGAPIMVTEQLSTVHRPEMIELAASVRPCLHGGRHDWLFQYNSFGNDPKSHYCCQICRVVIATRIGHLPINQVSNN